MLAGQAGRGELPPCLGFAKGGVRADRGIQRQGGAEGKCGMVTGREGPGKTELEVGQRWSRWPFSLGTAVIFEMGRENSTA